MSLIRLCRVSLNYGHMAKFGLLSRSIVQPSGTPFLIHGYSLRKRIFSGKSASFAFAFDSHFQSYLHINDLEVIPNKPSLPKVLMLLSSESSGPKAPPFPQPPSTVEPASSSTSTPENNAEKGIEPKKPKKTLWAKFKHEMLHYYNGFRLLGVEVRIAAGMCHRVLRGEALNRRERNQLLRTVADIIRLVPFVVFIVVPFMEFLIPIYLRFFPFMLPSTFKEKTEEENKLKNKLHAKLKLAKFLQDTIIQTVDKTNPAKSKDMPTIEEFQKFMETVRSSGQMVSNSDILRFSRLFEDHVTLEALDVDQLRALCKMLDIIPLSGAGLMRWQIHYHLSNLRKEDMLLLKEGLDNTPLWELRLLSRRRGMRSIGLTEARLRAQLKQWIELHLEKQVPVSLLLLSRAFYMQDTTVEPERQIQMVISKLPEAVQDQAEVKAVLELPGKVDPARKLEILRKEQKNIDAQRKAAEIAGEDVRQAAEIESLETLTDKAEILEPRSSEQLLDTAQKLDAKPLKEPLKPIVPPAKPAEFPTEPEVSNTVPHPPPAAAITYILKPLKVVEKASIIPPTPKPVPANAKSKPAGEAVCVDKGRKPDILVFSEDIGSIKEAILNMDEAKGALEEEHLLDLKADLDEAVKLAHKEAEVAEKVEAAETVVKAKEGDVKEEPKAEVSTEKKAEVREKAALELEKAAPTLPSVEPTPPTAVIKEVETKKEEIPTKVASVESKTADTEKEVEDKDAVKKAVKAQKAVKRLNAQVDRLLGDISGLMDQLQAHKQELQHKLQAELEAKMLSEEEQKAQEEKLKIDHQRMIGVGTVMNSLERLQKAAISDPEARDRWLRILEALDEDHDGHIEFKHILGLLELFGEEKVALKASSLTNVLEMLDKEELEKEESVEKTESSKPTSEDSVAATKEPKSHNSE